MLALDPLETLDDVFSGSDLNITALLRRYRGLATIPAINSHINLSAGKQFLDCDYV